MNKNICGFSQAGAWLPSCHFDGDCPHKGAGAWFATCHKSDAVVIPRVVIIKLNELKDEEKRDAQN